MSILEYICDNIDFPIFFKSYHTHMFKRENTCEKTPQVKDYDKIDYSHSAGTSLTSS